MTRPATPLSRAFFLELILVFVIFAVCAVVCLQVFAAASSESKRSVAVSEIGIRSQQIAENFKVQGGEISKLAADTGATRDGTTFLWYFDKNSNATDSKGAHFVLTCDVGDSGVLKVATMTLTEGSNELFSYEVSKYPQPKAVR
jgi:Tfp pilus assembly protein PilE